jgi:hypothetical protein
VLDHSPAELVFDVDRAAFRLPVYGGDISHELVSETLAERAQLLSPINLDIEALSRHERRRTARIMGVASLIVVLTAGGSAGVALKRSSTPQASPAPTPSAEPTQDPSIKPPLPWPTRGNLADNAEALAEMRVGFAAQNRFIAGGIQVLLAEDLAAGRLGLVAGKHDNGSDQFAWYFAPAGKEVQPVWWHAYPPSVSGGEDDTMVVAIGLPTGQTFMVVLGPEDVTSAEVSWRPSFPPDGTVVRTFEPLPVADGAVVVDLGSRPPHLIRIRLEGKDFYLAVLPSIAPGRDVLTWRGEDAKLKAEYGEADPDRVRGALGQFAAALGVTDMAEVNVRVIWGATFGDDPAALIHASLRSGGDFEVLTASGGTWVWVVPQGAPDFPVAWPILTDQAYQTIGVLAGPKAVQVEFRVGDPVLSGKVEPFSVRTFDVPVDWNVTEPAPVIVLRDVDGKLLWTRPLMQLPGPTIQGD